MSSGPGLVVAAFAKVCRHATGIDLTPAMIEKAREHAAVLALTNVDWHTGNVLPLPFADGASRWWCRASRSTISPICAP